AFLRIGWRSQNDRECCGDCETRDKSWHEASTHVREVSKVSEARIERPLRSFEVCAQYLNGVGLAATRPFPAQAAGVQCYSARRASTGSTVAARRDGR